MINYDRLTWFSGSAVQVLFFNLPRNFQQKSLKKMPGIPRKESKDPLVLSKQGFFQWLCHFHGSETNLDTSTKQHKSPTPDAPWDWNICLPCYHKCQASDAGKYCTVPFGAFWEKVLFFFHVSNHFFSNHFLEAFEISGRRS